MLVALEELSACRKKIKVDVDTEEIKKKLSNAYKMKSKVVKIKGFRKGKVPLSILKRHYAKEVKEGVLHEIINESYRKAISDNALMPLDNGEISEDTLEIKEGEDLTFHFLINTRPKLDLKEYKNLELKSTPPKSVTDEDIEKAIKGLQERYFTLEVSEGKPVESADVVKVSYKCTYEGKTVEDLTKDGTYVVAKSKEEQDAEGVGFAPISSVIMGMSLGEEKEVDITLPDNFGLEDVAGKEVHFYVKIDEIKTKVLPEFNDEFAAKFAKANAEEMREDVKASLLNEADNAFKRLLRDEAAEALLAMNEVPYPEDLLEKDLVRWENDNSKLKEEKSEEEFGELKKKAEGNFISSYKIGFIVSEIAKVEGIDISEEELKAKVQVLAQYSGQDYGNIMGNREYVEHIQWEMLKEKVLNFVVDESKTEAAA